MRIIAFTRNSFNSKVEQKWMEDFYGQVFFSHGKTNSCDVLISYFGTEKFTVKKTTNRP